jgi:hypothetical protein
MMKHIKTFRGFTNEASADTNAQVKKEANFITGEFDDSHNQAEISVATNEASSDSFQSIHRDVFFPAKEEFIRRIQAYLEGAGITVKKYEGKYPDTLAYDSFDCEYDGKSFSLNFSNSGYSLRINGSGTAYTGVNSLIKGVKSL